VSNFRNDRYLYISQQGYENYNLCFRKAKNVQINIRLGGIGTGIDYCPSSVFTSEQSTMQHFIIKLNITPFK
jgi:hypothetical protein